MAAAVFPVAVQKFVDSSGNPLAAGKIYTYVAGSSTPLALYTDVALAVPFSNPIILDSQGSVGAPAYMATSSAYKFDVQTSAGVSIDGYPADNISAPIVAVSTPAVPTGAILDFGGTSAPTGYLLCDGSAVSRSTYSALFAVIATNYGSGNGSTTFNVPDFRGRSSLGTGTGSGLTPRSIGASGGEETHVLITAELAAHTHTIGYTVLDGATQNSHGFAAAAVNATFTSSSTGSDTAHNTLHPFLVATKIVKT